MNCGDPRRRGVLAEVLAAGQTAEVRFLVDETMLAAFDGEVVHPVLGTVWLIYHLELAGRRLILPYLRDDQEGIGHAISVVHRAPAPLGTVVVATARVESTDGNRVVAAVSARTLDGTLIADGQFTQVILPKTVLMERIGSVRT